MSLSLFQSSLRSLLLSSVSVVAVSAFAASACSESSEPSSESPNSLMPGPGASSEECPAGSGCVSTCTGDPECPSGQYCKDGVCGADCTPTGGECGDGVCSASGRCEAANPGPNEPGPALIGDDDEPVVMDAGACIDVVTGFDTVIPTVLLLIDQSLSMDESFDGGGGASRWDTVRTLLIDPANGLIPALQDVVRFGLTLYSAEPPAQMDQFGGMNPPPVPPFGGVAGNQNAPDPNPAGGGMSGFFASPQMTLPDAGTPAEPPVDEPMEECPALVNVPIALNNFAAIETAYAGAEPLYSTPTAQSVDAASSILQAYTEEGPKVLILATDGEPSDCSGNNRGSEANRAASVASVEAAFAAGIETYIISVGADIAPEHLEDLASAGSSQADAAPYSALNGEDLQNAFWEIIGSVQSCSFALDGEIPERFASEGTVTINGVELVFDDPNGWTMPDTSTVELTGTACEQIQNGTGEVNISFPCIPEREIAR